MDIINVGQSAEEETSIPEGTDVNEVSVRSTPVNVGQSAWKLCMSKTPYPPLGDPRDFQPTPYKTIMEMVALHQNNKP